MVKLVNSKFKKLFATEQVGLNNFLASRVFKEIRINSARRSAIPSHDRKEPSETLSLIKILAQRKEGKQLF